MGSGVDITTRRSRRQVSYFRLSILHCFVQERKFAHTELHPLLTFHAWIGTSRVQYTVLYCVLRPIGCQCVGVSHGKVNRHSSKISNRPPTPVNRTFLVRRGWVARPQRAESHHGAQPCYGHLTLPLSVTTPSLLYITRYLAPNTAVWNSPNDRLCQLH